MTASLQQPLTISDDVVARQVGEETMLLDLGTGTYHGLDAVGGRFWTLIEERGSLAAARDAMLEEFDVPADQLDRDLGALVDDLAAKGLLVEN